MKSIRMQVVLDEDVGLLGLSFKVFQLLENVGEVILQILLQCNNVFWIHAQKFIGLIHRH